MRGMLRMILVAALVGTLALATASLGRVTQTEDAHRAAVEGERHRERRDKVRDRFGSRHAHKDRCGRARAVGGSRKRGRLVHSETKVRVEQGFRLFIADRGRITAVDANARTVSIERADGTAVTATAGENTRICKDGARATISDLKTGDVVFLRQVQRDGDRRLKGVVAHTPGEQSGWAGVSK